MTLSAQDVRDVRFGTTRVRAGYDMTEVDAFLDVVEAAITEYAARSQQDRDDASALRSQVAQMQARLAAMQVELEECQARSAASPATEHDTVVTPLPSPASSESDEADVERTAETPVVGADAQMPYQRLVRVRDEVRAMLNRQLALVDELDLEQR